MLLPQERFTRELVLGIDCIRIFVSARAEGEGMRTVILQREPQYSMDNWNAEAPWAEGGGPLRAPLTSAVDTTYEYALAGV